MFESTKGGEKTQCHETPKSIRSISNGLSGRFTDNAIKGPIYARYATTTARIVRTLSITCTYAKATSNSTTQQV